MKKFSAYSGLAALALVLAGVFGYILAPQFLGFYVIPWALALVGLAVFAAFNLEEIRGFLFSRGARLGAGSLVSILLVGGIVIILALLTAQHSARFDLTANKRFTLAEQTQKVLAGLGQPVEATAFYQEGGAKAQAESLLSLYAHASDRFTYRFVDADRDPALAKSLDVTRYGTVVLKVGDGQESLFTPDEQQLTNAIVRLTRKEAKKVYFLTGHGEKDIEDYDSQGISAARKTLSNQGYEVEKLLLASVADTPLDAAVIVMAGPRKTPLETELTALTAYLEKGGRLMVLVDPQEAEGLNAFLAGLRVRLGQDVILDRVSRIFGGEYHIPLVQDYTSHPITRNFSLMTFYPLARSVEVLENGPENVAAVGLARTTSQAWAETDLDRLASGEAEFNEDADTPGPVNIAAAGVVSPPPDEDGAPGTEGRFVVIGDSDFISNANINSEGNGDFFFACLGWLAEEGDLISIRPKQTQTQTLLLTPLTNTLAYLLPLAVLPLVVLFVGLVVWRRRARQ